MREKDGGEKERKARPGPQADAPYAGVVCRIDVRVQERVERRVWSAWPAAGAVRMRSVAFSFVLSTSPALAWEARETPPAPPSSSLTHSALLSPHTEHALEQFLDRLLTGAASVAATRGDAVISGGHLKAAAAADEVLDFCGTILAGAADLGEAAAGEAGGKKKAAGAAKPAPKKQPKKRAASAETTEEEEEGAPPPPAGPPPARARRPGAAKVGKYEEVEESDEEEAEEKGAGGAPGGGGVAPAPPAPPAPVLAPAPVAVPAVDEDDYDA